MLDLIEQQSERETRLDVRYYRVKESHDWTLDQSGRETQLDARLNRVIDRKDVPDFH